MKKRLCMALCLCTLIVLTACSSETSFQFTSDETSSTNSPQPGDKMDDTQMIYKYETREIDVPINEQNIYGIAYIPRTEEKVPLVIFSHELGSTHRSGVPYAESLASHGIASYIFDFRGGSSGSRSDGETTEMSAMTEADDIEAILDTAREWDFIDSNKIALIGASQGGMASAIVAARSPEQIEGLILLYPALLIPDAVHWEFDSLDVVPDQFMFNGWILVGKNYAEDVWNYDTFGEMSNFERPVLILHGDKDTMVDISYSERAAESYPSAEIHVIRGAGHGFYGSSFNTAEVKVTEFESSYAGQLGTYVVAVNHQLKTEKDKPTLDFRQYLQPSQDFGLGRVF